MFRRISEHLYSYADTCNVYALKDGPRAVLIDVGSGRVLDELGEIGVSGVDMILHTHHHRDQCQGDRLANERGIPVAVPAHERPYFDEVEVFWGSRQIYNIFNVRQTLYTLAESVEIARSLVDYETVAWGPYKLFVQPTPGHSLGHIALIGTVDGKRVAFTGDLIAPAGRLHTLYDLQCNYGSNDGCDHLIYSLGKLREHGPDLACPSHGAPFSDVCDATLRLERTLRVEVVREDREQTPGLGRFDCDRVPNDTLRVGGDIPTDPGHAVTWNGGAADIDQMTGQVIRLRFCVDNYDLYSFRAARG